jgi:choline/ethanolamine phosphotransferase
MVSASLITFYTAHWQTYVTGALKFGYVDVTEAQAVVCVIFALTGLFGDWIWSTRVPVLDLELRYIPAITGSMGSLTSIFRNLSDISKGGKGKNGSSVAVRIYNFNLETAIYYYV